MAWSEFIRALCSASTLLVAHAMRPLDEPPRPTLWKVASSPSPDRLYLTCTIIGACNFIIFCVAVLALLRVLRAAARDLYNSPRRRLLELDDGMARRRPGRICALCQACRPWTTQKAMLAMVALVAALRMAWAVLASHAWDAGHGLVRVMLHNSVRVVFYSLGYFESAASYTLFTMVAKFWAELASAARQGTISARPLGGGDEYRPRGTPPVIWKIARGVQRVSCAVAYAAAAIATLLALRIWTYHNNVYVSVPVAFFEASAFVLAALVMVTFAHYAVAELRLVPIELPTRRRRVYRITVVTSVCATCLVLRAGVLLWAADRLFPVDTDEEVLGILAYFLLLEGLPLGVVLMYNRTAPLSPSRPFNERVTAGRRRSAPEEEPLMGVANDDINVFHNQSHNQSQIPTAIVHR